MSAKTARVRVQPERHSKHTQQPDGNQGQQYSQPSCWPVDAVSSRHLIRSCVPKVRSNSARLMHQGQTSQKKRPLLSVRRDVPNILTYSRITDSTTAAIAELLLRPRHFPPAGAAPQKQNFRPKHDNGLREAVCCCGQNSHRATFTKKLTDTSPAVPASDNEKAPRLLSTGQVQSIWCVT